MTAAAPIVVGTQVLRHPPNGPWAAPIGDRDQFVPRHLRCPDRQADELFDDEERVHTSLFTGRPWTAVTASPGQVGGVGRKPRPVNSSNIENGSDHRRLESKISTSTGSVAAMTTNSFGPASASSRILE